MRDDLMNKNISDTDYGQRNDREPYIILSRLFLRDVHWRLPIMTYDQSEIYLKWFLLATARFRLSVLPDEVTMKHSAYATVIARDTAN